MTAPARPGGAASGLLGKLMAAVRSEFRSDVLEFDAEDPVFGRADAGWPDATALPAAGGCVRGICSGGPTRDARTWSSSPRHRSAVARRQPNQRCRVAAAVTGLPAGDVRAARAAMATCRPPRPGRWLADPPAVKRPEPGATCRIPHCALWPQAASPFCQTHTNTWKVNGRPDIDEFAGRFAETRRPADEIIRLDRLAPQLKLEMQYVLQRRHDERQGKLTPEVVMRVVRMLATEPVTSLLDHDEDTWHDRARAAINDSLPRPSSATPTGDRRPGRGRRMGSRIPARCLADAPPRLRRRPHPAVRPGYRSRGCGNWPNGGCGGGCRPGWAWKPAAADRSS